jgi:hypothetical protein
MVIQGNGYTVAQIDKALERAQAALSKLPEGAVNPATAQMLMELYLGALDADTPRAKSASN